MRHRIVLTRPDASVSSVLPSENAIRWMCNGGRWPDKLRGWFDEQMRCHLEAGHSERVTVAQKVDDPDIESPDEVGLPGELR
jgi:hypothetical protein